MLGIDLVAMNVNDVLAQGAEPLFFLDYFACGHLDVSLARDVIKGIVDGCLQSGCALIGGETAEMPGLYEGKDYDAAGFVVGAVERDQILPRLNEIKAGDVLIGVSSSGVHSNGFSLVRKIVARSGLSYDSPAPFGDSSVSLGRALLTPTRIYVKSLLPIVKKGLIKAMAHITGGGFPDNIPRVLPDELGVVVDAASWELPPVFKWLKATGQVAAGGYHFLGVNGRRIGFLNVLFGALFPQLKWHEPSTAVSEWFSLSNRAKRQKFLPCSPQQTSRQEPLDGLSPRRRTMVKRLS